MSSINPAPIGAAPTNEFNLWSNIYRAFFESLFYQFNGDTVWNGGDITAPHGINVTAGTLMIGGVQWPTTYEDDTDYILTQINDRFYWTKLSEYGMIGAEGQVEWTVSQTAPDGWENVDASVALNKLQCIAGDGYDILDYAGLDTETYTPEMLPQHEHDWYYGLSSGTGQDPTRASIQQALGPTNYVEYGNITTLITDPKATLAGTYSYDAIDIKQPTISLNTIIKL